MKPLGMESASGKAALPELDVIGTRIGRLIYVHFAKFGPSLCGRSLQVMMQLWILYPWLVPKSEIVPLRKGAPLVSLSGIGFSIFKLFTRALDGRS